MERLQRRFQTYQHKQRMSKPQSNPRSTGNTIHSAGRCLQKEVDIGRGWILTKSQRIVGITYDTQETVEGSAGTCNATGEDLLEARLPQRHALAMLAIRFVLAPTFLRE